MKQPQRTASWTEWLLPCELRCLLLYTRHLPREDGARTKSNAAEYLIRALRWSSRGFILGVLSRQ